MNDNDLLKRLDSWFQKRCDGDWEHDSVVKIFNFDNPGWGVEININLEHESKIHAYIPIYIEKENKIITTKIKKIDNEYIFEGYSSSGGLFDLIEEFLSKFE